MHRKAIVFTKAAVFLLSAGAWPAPVPAARNVCSPWIPLKMPTSHCSPSSSHSPSFFLLLAVSLLAASSLPVVTAIACAVMNHLTFSIPHSARHILFSFPHFLTLLGQKIAIYTAFFTLLHSRGKNVN